MSFLITFLALNFVVFIHELGHFWAAKRAGIGVPEFSLGMGPLVFGKTFKGTFFSFRLLPLGGFVKLSGLDDTDCPPESNYLNKTKRQRGLTLAAGSLMNILLGFVVLFFMAFSLGTPKIEPIIDEVVEGTPAYLAGFQSQDTLIAMNGSAIQDVRKDFMIPIKDLGNKKTTIQVQRGSEVVTLSVVPAMVEGAGQIGIILGSTTQRFNPIHSLIVATNGTIYYGSAVFKSIQLLVSGAVSAKEISGPVGLVQVASNQLQQGFFQFFSIMAMISISLGVINLFPLPVLDGGHLMFLGIEAIRNKPLSKAVESRINQVAISCLIVLTVMVFLNDVKQWGNREKQLDAFNSGQEINPELGYDKDSQND